MKNILVVGLGNPGERYVHTRHNMGFLAIDEIAHFNNFPSFKIKYNSLVSEHTIAEQKIILIKPQTYMNLSGQPVKEIAHFYKLDPEDAYVIHDDLALELGKLKIKQGGGDGGHNGLRSIDAHLGNNYWRLRMGIGHPGHKDLVTSFVLGKISPTETKIFAEQIYNIARNFLTLINGDHQLFLTRIAQG